MPITSTQQSIRSSAATRAAALVSAPKLGPGGSSKDIYVEIITMHDDEMALAKKYLREAEQSGPNLCGYISPANMRLLEDRGIMVQRSDVVIDTIESPPQRYPAHAVISARGPLWPERRATVESLGVTVRARMGSNLRRGIRYGANQLEVQVPSRQAWQALARTSFIVGLRVFDPNNDWHPGAY